MLLREIPKSNLNPHPYPWLFAREQQGDERSKNLLNLEVSEKFVCVDGGTLIYVPISGNWVDVASFHPKGWQIKNHQYWHKLHLNKNQIVGETLPDLNKVWMS